MADTPILKPVYGAVSNVVAPPTRKAKLGAKRGQVPQGPDRNKKERKNVILEGLRGAR